MRACHCLGTLWKGFLWLMVIESFVPAKASSELSSQLGKIGQRVDAIMLKVRRGNTTLKLHAFRFTMKAVTNHRLVALLQDLTPEDCTQLQEMRRGALYVDCLTFSGMGVKKYAWKMKVGTYLPNARLSVVGSILFMPLHGEGFLQSTTARNVATWAEKGSSKTTVGPVKGTRLWFLPGDTEVPSEMTPQPGETKFRTDMRQTDEGSVCVSSVTTDTAADRAGLRHLHQEANTTGHLPVISRIEGKSLMPTSVCSAGLIYRCELVEIRGNMASAIEQMESIQVNLMAWPKQTHPANATAEP